MNPKNYEILQYKRLTKIKAISRGVLLYGVYPTLIVLKEQERLEHYENCAIIKKAMDNLSEMIPDLNTSTSIENLKSFYYQNIKDRPIIENNMKAYVDGMRMLVAKELDN